jgi:hypothetical protein
MGIGKEPCLGSVWLLKRAAKGGEGRRRAAKGRKEEEEVKAEASGLTKERRGNKSGRKGDDLP